MPTAAFKRGARQGAYCLTTIQVLNPDARVTKINPIAEV